MNNEQREQQMMDAADRYADEVCDGSCTGAQVAETINDFCAGWRASDSYPNWISVVDDLPPIQDKGTYSDLVLVCGTKGEIDTAKYSYMSNRWQCNAVLLTVTHWMPIVPPRKEDKK